MMETRAAEFGGQAREARDTISEARQRISVIDGGLRRIGK